LRDRERQRERAQNKTLAVRLTWLDPVQIEMEFGFSSETLHRIHGIRCSKNYKRTFKRFRAMQEEALIARRYTSNRKNQQSSNQYK
jgi:hypothetical protein